MNFQAFHPVILSAREKKPTPSFPLKKRNNILILISRIFRPLHALSQKVNILAGKGATTSSLSHSRLDSVYTMLARDHVVA